MDILIFDHDRDARDLMAELLALDGLFAKTVGTLEEAVAALQRHSFRLIFVDVPMYDPRTRLVAKALRACSPAASLVAISASEVWDKQSFDHYLSKPIDYGLLYRLVRPKP